MPKSISEAETRYSLIDPDLKKAGWILSDRSEVRIKISAYQWGCFFLHSKNSDVPFIDVDNPIFCENLETIGQ